MAERASDRWVSIVLSVLLHGTLVAVLVYGFWTYHKSRPPAPTLAIEAVVVDPRSVKGAVPAPQPKPQPQPAPAPAPAPEPVEPTGPPEPTPEELAQREQAQKEQQQKEEEADRQAAEQRKLDEQKQQQQEQRQAEEKRQELKKREEQRQAEEAKKRADEQRVADQKRQEQAQREADAKNKAELEADLKRSLAAEEHSMAARSSGALASWQAQITARIQHAWLRPPSARPGIECVLYVTQVPGGEVVNVRIGTCNGDQAVRESIEAAAYRASPLPPPPDPSLFERNLEITFKPD